MASRRFRRPPLPVANEKNIRRELGRFFEHEGIDPAIASRELASILASVRSGREIQEALKAADLLLNAHGVEDIRSDKFDEGRGFFGDTAALYVNMGDPYVATILYDRPKDKFYVTGYGDWVERNERAYGLR